MHDLIKLRHKPTGEIIERRPLDVREILAHPATEYELAANPTPVKRVAAKPILTTLGKVIEPEPGPVTEPTAEPSTEPTVEG